jgi:glycosyltransferase involved in cell wall biosynthesis
MAEEYVDAGVWPADGSLFRATKRAERMLVRSADGIVVLTEKAKSIFHEWYAAELRKKPLAVIPCCVDFRRLPNNPPGTLKKSPPDDPVFVYAGKFGGWYLTSETIQFVTSAVSVFPKLRWKIWTQSDKTELSHLIRSSGIQNHVDIGFLTPDALALELRQVHVGLALIKPCFSKSASSATKVAEYLLSGLPVIATAGIGDTDQILCPDGHEAVGVLLRGFGSEEYQQAIEKLKDLLNDPLTPGRCRSVAEKFFHLEEVGWPLYRSLYGELLSTRSC